MKEAIEKYRAAVEINPNNFEALNNLGFSLCQMDQFDEAIEINCRAIRLNPSVPGAYYHLGLALDRSGRTHEAVPEYREAIKLDPDLVEALNDLAWVLAANSDDQLRNGDEAVRLSQHACELTHYERPLLIGTLAAAYAEAGRFSDAVAKAKQAEEIATKSGLKEVAGKNQQLLEFYRAGKPYHELRSLSQ